MTEDGGHGFEQPREVVKGRGSLGVRQPMGSQSQARLSDGTAAYRQCVVLWAADRARTLLREEDGARVGGVLGPRCPGPSVSWPPPVAVLPGAMLTDGQESPVALHVHTVWGREGVALSPSPQLHRLWARPGSTRGLEHPKSSQGEGQDQTAGCALRMEGQDRAFWAEARPLTSEKLEEGGKARARSWWLVLGARPVELQDGLLYGCNEVRERD